MSKKGILGVLLFSLCASGTPSFSGRPVGVSNGQVQMDVGVYLSIGTAVADHNGIEYTVGMQSFRDTDALYPPEYWGTYPLYSVGLIPAVVSITYTAGAASPSAGTTQASVRAQLVTESHVINLDGSSGMQQKTPDTHSLLLQSGEPSDVEVSFTMLPNTENRLNRLVAELCLPDGRVLTKEAIYAPLPAD